MSGSNGMFKTILLLSATAVLGACGGGSGGGSSAGIEAGDPVTIGAANAGSVAGATLDATGGLTGNTEGAVGLFPAAVGQSRPAQINVIDTILEQIKKAPQLFPAESSRVSPEAVQSFSENCETGSMSGKFNDNDDDLMLSTGDSINISANSCTFGGVTINGSIRMNNVVLSGDELSPPYSMQFTLQATDFSVTSGGETVVMRGGGTIIESSSDGISFTSSFTGDGIEITAGSESLTLTDYNIQETENQATGAYSISVNATITSPTLGGSVIVTTDAVLTGVGSLDPDAGQITCVGAGNTSVTVTAIDAINVQLEVDQDGDGNVDQTLTAAWADL